MSDKMRRPTVRCTERGCEFIALRRLADDVNLTSRQLVKSLASQTARILPQVKANLPHSRTEFAVIYVKFAAV